MIKHFLIMFFSAFIAQVIFINLFQFSGAILPFDYDPDIIIPVNTNTSLFGFSSLLTFAETISHDTYINIGIQAIGKGVSMLQHFSIDSIVELFEFIYDADFSKGDGLVILTLIQTIVRILRDMIIAPLTWSAAILVIAMGVLIFLWQMITILCFLISGRYNMPIHSSGLLDSTAYNLPNLLWCLPAHVRSC